MNNKLLVFFLFLITVSSCREKKSESKEEMARRAVRTEKVIVQTIKLEPSTFYHELISNGKVSAHEKVIVPFRVNGTITELNIMNGQMVNAGDLLACIEDFNYSTQLERARQRLEKAEIDFRDDLLRNYQGRDTADLPEGVLKMARIRSGLTEARTSLKEAEYNYMNTRITAPIRGRIAHLEARKLNHSGSYRNLCSIINDEFMVVDFPVIESEYQFLSVGMPVAIVPFSDDSHDITGHISEINPAVNESGMIMVRASFRNNGRLIEGMNVKILIRKPYEDRLVVPKEALVMRQGKDVIFVREDSLAIWRYVEIEAENSYSLSVKSGLSPGDLVIVRGNTNLSHETIVKEDGK